MNQITACREEFADSSRKRKTHLSPTGGGRGRQHSQRHLPEETQIPSTTEVAVTLKVNPATVNRGVNLLVDEGIIYKKRGVGMFVSTGAREKILARRRQAFYQNFLLPLLEEASNIGLSRQDVIGMLNHSDQHGAAERSSQNEHD
jgi:GntR family transcriptional regulator